MISYQTGDMVFNHRIVSVIIDDGYVLLHRDARDAFWALPGGRAELFELSETTVKREMIEELGNDAVVSVERLMWTVEDFHHFRNLRYHEFALYYLVHFVKGSPYLDKTKTFSGIESDCKLTFKWFALDQLKSLVIFPSFLPQKLNGISDSLEHIIHNTLECRPGANPN